jgi:mono/diheme cytochrome c family protein
MKATLDSLKVVLVAMVFAAGLWRAAAQPTPAVSTAPVYKPDYTHQNDPLPTNGILNWDALQKTVDATNGQDYAHFIFLFTNVACHVDLAQVTNFSYTTNITVVTNTGFWHQLTGRKHTTLASVTTNASLATVTNSITPIPVTIIDVHPSCGCTTAELPSRPWLLPPGTNSAIRLNVNLAGKSGVVYKTAMVSTDKGKLDLKLLINIHPAPEARPMTDAERAAGVAAAKIDRQAVFRGDCVSCHAKNVKGKFGQQLFALTCAVCHDAKPRASMVPDLHNLKDPTSEQFWNAWITSGKPGTLMPAFATAQGGPLDDMQISSLANYLSLTIPSHAPAATGK